MKRLVFVIVVFALFVGLLSGCNKSQGGSYADTLVYNNTQYGVSEEKVDKNSIETELGEIKQKVYPVPKVNFDSNTVPVGTKLYKIKDIDTSKYIALYKDNDYFKATSFGPQPSQTP